ncbi:MAG: response regulator transcription factor [Clostridia bacterium]|nr:response regulator transcription factor [Clostridia bacterium]
MQRLILIIEDEKPIVDILKFNLERENYKVIYAMDGEEGLSLALSKAPDLILLDVMLPGMDGFDVCRRVREKSTVPILMLTARDEELDKVVGLEMGADDYITKPFGVRELMARVKAHLRRTDKGTETKESQVIRFGEYSILCDRYEITRDGQVVELTLREFELLKFLAQQPGRIFTRENLLEQVWGYEYFGEVRTVDVTIRRLREKIEDNPAEPRYIITKRGVGYYLKAE